MDLAPIVLFVYNRPWHTQQTVESLKKNILAGDSDLIIYSDEAQNSSLKSSVNEVRKFIKTIDGFKNIEIIERNKNLGLAKSVITGVTEVINKYKKIIVLEDDLLTTADFLSFMNKALIYYKNMEQIFSISGYNFPMEKPKEYKYDVFCSYRFISWGWGTWSHSWNKADWTLNNFNHFLNNKKLQLTFNKGGDDLSDMLISQFNGKIDSWAIVWLYTHFQHNVYSVCPIQSKVFNIGFDGTGIHCNSEKRPQANLQTKFNYDYSFMQNVFLDNYFITKIKNYHKYSYKRKIYNFFKNIIERN